MVSRPPLPGPHAHGQPGAPAAHQLPLGPLKLLPVRSWPAEDKDFLKGQTHLSSIGGALHILWFLLPSGKFVSNISVPSVKRIVLPLGMKCAV